MERRKFSREFKLEAVRLIKERGVAIARHMWNGHAGKRFFRHFTQRDRCGHMSGLSARSRPLASMKFAMRGADQSDAL
ncbi:hypothetical protein ABID19_006519 [Mesorhizobium robiniae]|uniref:Transposase n=1 Tax=Mesorhizobium robiniae TaxID=559315 RepID=A0ABV2GYT3_9HYPH